MYTDGPAARAGTGCGGRSSWAGCALVVSHMAGVLYGVRPEDPLTFVASRLFIHDAVFSCYIPARRARSRGPIVALRYE